MRKLLIAGTIVLLIVVVDAAIVIYKASTGSVAGQDGTRYTQQQLADAREICLGEWSLDNASLFHASIEKHSIDYQKAHPGLTQAELQTKIRSYVVSIMTPALVQSAAPVIEACAQDKLAGS